MKVLHVIDSGGLYGAEIMLLNLVTEQLRLGLQPVIASIGETHLREKPLEEAAIKKGLPLKTFRMQAGLNIAGAIEIIRFAKRENFDLFHSHGYKGNILLGMLPRRVRKLPLVTTVHGWTSTRGLTRMRIYEWLDRWFLRHADVVVLVNDRMRSHPGLLKRPGINLQVVNNGIPDFPSQRGDRGIHIANSGATPLDPKVIDFCRQGFCVGAIGRLSREKGHRILVDAFQRLIRQGIDARLVILGEGGERDALEKMVVERDLAGKVLIPGYRESACDYLSCFDVLVNPSLTEGLPITILEAMQAKTPIVATAVGGVPEVLMEGAAGILVPAGDVEGLVDGILRLRNDPKMKGKMVNLAYTLVGRDYSCRAMAEKYLEVYRSSRNLTPVLAS